MVLARLWGCCHWVCIYNDIHSFNCSKIWRRTYAFNISIFFLKCSFYRFKPSRRLAICLGIPVVIGGIVGLSYYIYRRRKCYMLHSLVGMSGFNQILCTRWNKLWYSISSNLFTWLIFYTFILDVQWDKYTKFLCYP